GRLHADDRRRAARRKRGGRAMRFRALVQDAVREIAAGRVVLVLYALMMGGGALAEWFVLGANSTMTVTTNGHTQTTHGGGEFAHMVLPAAADAIGKLLLFFLILGMSGVMSSVMKRGTAEIYLSKPVSRRSLLVARALGTWLVLLALLVVSGAL